MESALSEFDLSSPLITDAGLPAGGGGGGGGEASAATTEALMDQIRAQVAAANAQELLGKMADKCFRKCVRHPPGAALGGSEQKCVAMCMDRYMDCWNVVSRVYSDRIQRETKDM